MNEYTRLHIKGLYIYHQSINDLIYLLKPKFTNSTAFQKNVNKEVSFSKNSLLCSSQ